MSQIKEMPLKDYVRYAQITSNAFPGFGMNTPEDQKKLVQWLKKVNRLDPVVRAFGLYRKDCLLGGIRLFDFKMNYHNCLIPMGGGGLLAVDLAYKKEHVAKELMIYFLDYFKKKKCYITSLYPFRPDFYKKMGFGYGAKTNKYTIKPEHLPSGKSKKNVGFLEKRSLKAMENCYNRIAAKTHGMYKKCKYEMLRLENPRKKIIGFKLRNKVLGYIVFELKTDKGDNVLLHDIVISEMFYENREVLKGLLAFLNSQADQIRHVIYFTADDYFHYMPFDPRDNSENLIGGVGQQTNTQGLGLMYRVIDVKGLFKQLGNHNFNNQSCKVRINITDTFYRINNGSYIIHFVNGKGSVKKKGDYNIEIDMDISDFSSLMMGVISFRNLFKYSLTEISDEKYIDTINKVFFTEEKPYCVTQF